MVRLPRRGSYTGRLAFDPDSGFHIDPDGRRVVTDDEGRSWRYARRRDLSHNARHQLQVAVVDATVESEPHHIEPVPHDLHAQGLIFHPDAAAPTATSHTETWKELA